MYFSFIFNFRLDKLRSNLVITFHVSLFSSRLIKHTEQLLEEKEDKLCGKVLKTLQEMMAIDLDYGEKVSILYTCVLVINRLSNKRVLDPKGYFSSIRL